MTCLETVVIYNTPFLSCEGEVGDYYSMVL